MYNAIRFYYVADPISITNSYVATKRLETDVLDNAVKFVSDNQTEVNFLYGLVYDNEPCPMVFDTRRMRASGKGFLRK